MFKLNKRTWVIGVLVVTMMFLSVGCAGNNETPEGTDPAEDIKPYDLRISGGSPGSSVQVGAAGLSELIKKEDVNINATPLGSDGATANIRMVNGGEAEMGVAAATGMYWSLNSIAAFEGEDPYKDWRAVVPQGFVPLFGVTKESSGITKTSDLQGKKVSLGPSGSGTGATWGQLLPALELTGDFNFMPFDEGNQRLQEGMVDAALMGVRNIAASIEAQALLGPEAVWFGISEADLQEAGLEAFPSLSIVKLPANTYETQPEAFETLGYSLWILAHKDVPDDVVAKVVDLVVEKGQEALDGYGAWGEVWAFDLLPGTDILKSMNAPMHTGAIKYWEDKGVEIPDEIRAE